MGGLVLTPHVVYSGFKGEDAVCGNHTIVVHVGKRHIWGMGVGIENGEGIFWIGSVCRGGGVRRESKAAYGVRNVSEDRLSRGYPFLL